MSSLVNLQTYHQSPIMDCPYLPNQEEQLLFTTIKKTTPFQEFNRLNETGFRRTRNVFYFPVCQNCSACVPIRIRVKDYPFSESERRIFKKNQSLSITPLSANLVTQEHYQLFNRYVLSRHSHSDMVNMQFDDFKEMLLQEYTLSSLFEYRKDDTLVAIIIVDRFSKGLSAVYSAYDHHYHKLSLGKYMILSLIKHAIKQSFHYIYLGYWVKGHGQMDYKKQFKNIELFKEGRWT